MKLSEKDRDRLIRILTNTATSCYDAVDGKWDNSDDEFVALQEAAEEGLAILNAPMPEYEELKDG